MEDKCGSIRFYLFDVFSNSNRLTGKSSLSLGYITTNVNMHHKDTSGIFCIFLCILLFPNGYVKSAQWRGALTFSWILYTKSKRPTICWTPAWRHLNPIPLVQYYHWNASRHLNPPKTLLSDFSFYFSDFDNKTKHVKHNIQHSMLWNVCLFLISWNLVKVWLNKGN